MSRLLRTTARDTARASVTSAAPVTRQVMSVVAPSPSAACCRASERQTAVSAAPSCAASGLPGRGDSASEAPEASTKTVSLVEVSPSTLVCSKVAADASRRSVASSSGLAAASVSTTAIIVAIRGWIMPTPLATPETRTRRSERSSVGRAMVVVAALRRESVVMMRGPERLPAAGIRAQALGRQQRQPIAARGRPAGACR